MRAGMWDNDLVNQKEKGNIMAKEFYTINVVLHLENEKGEYDYVPNYKIQIDKCDNEKSSTTRRVCPELRPIEIIEKIAAISAIGHPYVLDFVDISYVVNLCRLDRLDAHRILRKLDDSDSVVFEVTVTHLLSQSI